MGKQRNPNGTGHFRQRKDGLFEWRQKVDGQERYVYAHTMKELNAKIKNITDLPIVKEKYKVDEWFQKWLADYIKPLKSQATYNQYSIIYNTHIKPVIGKRRLSTLKTYDIQHVIAKMNDDGLSAKTMKHAKSIMNIALTKAKKEKIIPINPVVDIEIPKKQEKPKKTLKPEELLKLFDIMANSRWIWSVKFALVTGLRRGELLALKWSDIDFDNKRITIYKSNSRTGLGGTKNKKVHYVPLTDNAITYLNGQKEQLKKESNPILFNDELKKSDLIFPTKYGTMVKPNTYYHLISKFGKDANIKVFPHAFRHTFVFITRDNLSLKDMQNILGHSESTTTLDIYGDILNDNVKDDIIKMDSAFDKINNEIKTKKEKKSKNKCKIIQFKKAE